MPYLSLDVSKFQVLLEAHLRFLQSANLLLSCVIIDEIERHLTCTTKKIILHITTNYTTSRKMYSWERIRPDDQHALNWVFRAH